MPSGDGGTHTQGTSKPPHVVMAAKMALYRVKPCNTALYLSFSGPVKGQEGIYPAILPCGEEEKILPAHFSPGCAKKFLLFYII